MLGKKMRGRHTLFQGPCIAMQCPFNTSLCPSELPFFFVLIPQSSSVWNSSPCFQAPLNYIFTKKLSQHIPSPNNLSSSVCRNKAVHVEVHFLLLVVCSVDGLQGPGCLSSNICLESLLFFNNHWNDVLLISSKCIRDSLMSWVIHSDWGLILCSSVIY